MSNPTNTTVYLPWSWVIVPLASSTRECPSEYHVLMTYFAATALTTLLTVIFGASPIVSFLTGGRIGDSESESWKWMWMAQLALHLGAEFIVAAITTNAQGYDQTNMPATWDLALFFVTRPRMAWIFLSFLGFSRPWYSIAKQTIISEIMMQVIGCYYLGRTTEFARKNGYYEHLHYDHAAQWMYGSALFTLIFSLGSSIALIYTLSAVQVARDKESSLRVCCAFCCAWLLTTVFGLSGFLGRWGFLVGFVKLAGDSYCPPSLAGQAATWISMNTLGAILGTGF